MALKIDAFPASGAFDVIQTALKDGKEKANAMKKGAAIFAFTLKNSSGETKTWFVDLKTTGTVGQGTGPDGKSADIVLSLSDDDFAKLIDGKVNSQKLFMSGKLKVKGDIMKAMRAEAVLKAAQTKKAKL
ncbi:SCP2 sterol-binding domain-containing protein [Lipomyces oligophaga]|uniref:SCP2 sterol-binding domain-containing protein n=1 Tax=Lipomyces oligophaga TaxID=45792 RepID=UPI0034CD180F